jgi:hypothetical protein
VQSLKCLLTATRFSEPSTAQLLIVVAARRRWRHGRQKQRPKNYMTSTGERSGQTHHLTCIALAIIYKFQ